MRPEDITAILTSLGALAGSVVLFYKSRSERKKVKAESVSVELNAIRKAYSAMLEDQMDSVVEPMQRRIDRLVEQVESMQRGKFEIAVMYIRSLCHWIDIKDKTGVSKPNLPDELREYFTSNGSKLQ